MLETEEKLDPQPIRPLQEGELENLKEWIEGKKSEEFDDLPKQMQEDLRKRYKEVKELLKDQ